MLVIPTWTFLRRMQSGRVRPEFSRSCRYFYALIRLNFGLNTIHSADHGISELETRTRFRHRKFLGLIEYPNLRPISIPPSPVLFNPIFPPPAQQLVSSACHLQHGPSQQPCAELYSAHYHSNRSYGHSNADISPSSLADTTKPRYGCAST